MIEIVIPGAPVPKGRPRFSGKTGHTYTPERTRNYEALIRLAAGDRMAGRPPFDGPIELTVDVRLPISGSWPKKRQAAARSGDERPVKRPDCDNFLKIALDALNLIVWNDDSQVVDARVSKHYSDTPGMTVRIAPITPHQGVFQ